MMKRFVKIIFATILLGASFNSFAILHLVLTQGVDSAIPMAVIPFGQNATDSTINLYTNTTNGETYKLGANNNEWQSESGNLNDSLSTKYGFRDDSILGETQRILDSLSLFYEIN